MICATETIGDITATCDVSRLEVEGKNFESRIQGGVLADGINGILSALGTLTPMTTVSLRTVETIRLDGLTTEQFAQNSMLEDRLHS